MVLEVEKSRVEKSRVEQSKTLRVSTLLVEESRVRGRGVKNTPTIDFWTPRLLDFSTIP
jgi:hypothetical protein